MTHESEKSPGISPSRQRPRKEPSVPDAANAKSGGAKSKKISNGLVALGSAAIISVYGLGYVRTQTAEALYNVDAPAIPIATAAPIVTSAASSSVAAYQSPLFASTATAATSAVGAAQPDAIATTVVPTVAATALATVAVPTVAAAAPATVARASATATTTTKAPAAAAYTDGTYTGTGTSRHGSIAATVVIQGGKIVSAEITQCGTRYPCSKVAALPGEVVARQSSAVDFVSGATDSSQAYQGAIANALAKAKVPA